MVRTKDPLLEVFRKRNDPEFREAAIKQIEEGASPRKELKKAKKAAAAKKKAAAAEV